MAEVLVVRLLAPASPDSPGAEWLVVDSSGARRGNVQSGDPANAAALAAGRRVFVLVPGTA
ncbi:MAG: hypothetical protein EHM84_07010, partial [Lysobacterales bacterium]